MDATDTGSGSGAGSGTASGSGAGTSTGDEGKLSLTQDELEDLIGKRLSRERRKLERELGGIAAEERAELDRLKKADEARATAEAEKKGEYEKAWAAKEKSLREEYEPKLTESQKREQVILDRYRQRTISESLVTAAAKLNAYDAKQVQKLLADNVKLNDDLEPTVVDDAGSPRFVGGKDMSIEQLVQEFLNKNPNLVRNTSNAGGSGATGGRTTTSGDASPVAELEAQLKGAEESYRKTKSDRDLTNVRVLSSKLREARAASAGAKA